jgi:dihydrofolate reductase
MQLTVGRPFFRHSSGFGLFPVELRMFLDMAARVHRILTRLLMRSWKNSKKKPADLLLARKTFEIFASFWPEHEDIWPGINDMTKYVMSNTMTTSDWKNSIFLKSLAEIEKIKNTYGPDLHVSGSGQLIQLLLRNDLVDELWLLIHPVTLGMGKQLFGDGTIPAAFTLTESVVSPTGVIIANYKRAGEVKTGTVGA